MKIRLNSEKEAYIETSTELSQLSYIPKITKGRSKDPTYYLKQPAFLDTETSHNHNKEDPIGWIYQWCFEFKGQYVIGRYPSDLIRQLKKLVDHYELNEKKRLVVYVHNLSYDHTYLYKYLRDEFGDPKILAIKPHKILSALYHGLEFRCTWLLSNMSLSSWGNKLKCKVLKMDNAIDYDVIRYPDEKLELIDWLYMVNDVAALKCAVLEEMKAGNDNICTIPLTSTGYVRRDCRRAASKEDGFRKWFKDTRLDWKTYLALFWAYSGGLTHGNRFYAGKIVEDDDHVDYKSFYPANNMLRYMPMGKWLYYYSYEERGSFMEWDELKGFLQTKCCIVFIQFQNLRLKKEVTCPIISKSKIYNFYDCKFTINKAGTVGTDNGRVINCEGQPLMYVTELDLYWILDQYENDGFRCIDLYISDRGYDRECIRQTTDSYFKVKESLEKDGYFYFKSKNKLNSIYGMKSTNIVRSDVELDLYNGEWSEVRDMSPEHITEALDRYYRSYNSFNNYSHGVYITAWARYLLLTAIRDVVGYKNYLYCDTDSIFYRSDPEIDNRLDKFNADIIKLNKDMNIGVKNRKGKMSYYGVLEKEVHIKQFIFLHAKCYAYTDMDDKLHCVIAGVTSDNRKKKEDPKYMTREQELGCIDNLQDGMTFKECGGTSSLYIDREPEIMIIDHHRVEVASACIIRNVTKELGGTVDGFNIYEVDYEL